MLTDLGILVVLVALNGFLSLCEMAVVTVNVNKIKIKAEQGDKRSELVKKVKENPSSFFSTIQIGAAFLSVFTGAYAASRFAEPAFLLFNAAYPWFDDRYLPVIVFVMTLVVAYFTVLFGELIPKRLAVAKPMEISLAIGSLINILSFLFLPVIKTLSFAADICMKLLRVSETNEDDVTEEEIRMMVDVRGEQGGIDDSGREMINNIFEFDDKTAGEIVTHRTKLLALPITCDCDMLKDAVISGRFSRIPVYENSIDNIIGVLYTHDVLLHIVKGNGLDQIDVSAIMRKPYFVHESKRTDELFKQMQKDRLHMSVVVDEYGGTLGIVTMEDLIEEIVGSIFDEYDEEELPDVEEITADAYLINGSLGLYDVSNLFKTPFPADKYDTLSGFLIGCIGHIPETGERAEAEYGGIVFKVHEVEEKRIKTIIAIKLQKGEKADV